MDIVIVVLMIGACIWFFLRRNTRKGTETVRAFVYLRVIGGGASVDEANTIASYDIAEGPTDTIRQALDFVRIEYGGSQSALIEDAKRAGLVMSAGNAGRGGTEPLSEPAPNADWLRPFVLFYVASEMSNGIEGDTPDTVRELAQGRLSAATEQSLLVQLKNYLSFAYGRDRMPDDLGKAKQEARIFLRTELQTGNSVLALKRLVRRMHTNSDGTPAPEHEIEDRVAEAVEQIRNSTEAATKLRSLILMDVVEELFETSHRMPIRTYLQKMDRDYRAIA